MPSYAVASRDTIDNRNTLKNGQVQRVHISARRSELAVIVGVCACRCIGLSVPGVLVTGGDGVCGVIVNVNVKVEGVGTWAAVSVGIVMSVHACRCICLPVPSVVVACILCVAVVGAVVDGQV